MNLNKRILILIFFLGLALRLIYFPKNVYFASDQARDAYFSSEVMHGDIKIIGPGTTLSKYISHGVLYYYIMGPVYMLSQGSPYIPALLIILLNALGVFVVFLIGKDLFNTKVGLICALLYAVSFEQSQYAIFFSHPGMALIFVLLYYLGLTELLFKNNSKGLILSALCAGIATQLHFSLIILAALLPIYVLLFHNNKLRLKRSDIFWSIVAWGLAMSTFFIAELKYKHWRMFILSMGKDGSSMFGFYINNFIYALKRYSGDNLIFYARDSILGVFMVIIIFGILIKKKSTRRIGLFLSVWFMAGSVAYLIGHGSTYYFGIGGSISLIIASAAIINFLWDKIPFAAFVLIGIIVVLNIYKIVTVNAFGPIDEIMAPPRMLLSDELRAIDYIYSQAGDEKFSIHGLTIPYNIKTTWDYLFNWYGKKKYGFVPVWGGEDALGSEGSLEVVRARSSLPEKQFLIVEPLVGLSDDVVNEFFKEEDYFTHFVSEKKFGVITVQIREKY
jgi:hypothetical protein